MVMTKTSKANMTWVGLTAAAILLTGAGTTFAQSDDVTFSRDIVPILQQNCQECHRQGQMGPMSLMTYDEVRPWAPVIKYKTGLRDKMGTMPPYYLERGVGIQQVKYDERLSEEQLQLIAQWADNGAPQGNPENLPPVPEFRDSNEWRLGPPDLVIPLQDLYVAGDAADVWVGGTPVLTGLTEDRWVRAIEMRPSTVAGRSITHHALAMLQQEEDDQEPLARSLESVAGGAKQAGSSASQQGPGKKRKKKRQAILFPGKGQYET